MHRPAFHEIDIGGERFAVVQLTVTEEAGTFRSHFDNLAPVAVMDSAGGEMVCCPGAIHLIAPGDRVAVIGTHDELERKRLWSSPGPSTRRPVGPTVAPDSPATTDP